MLRLRSWYDSGAMTVHFSKLRIVALATVITAAAVSPAESTNPWGLKLGLTFPTSGAVKDSISKTGFNIGASHRLTTTPLIKGRSTASVDLDYFRIGGGDHLEGIHLGYSERVFLGSQEAEVGPYAGFTLGVGFNRVKASADNNGGGGSGGGQNLKTAAGFSSSKDEKKFQVIGEILVGYKFTSQLGLEGFYRTSPKLDGVDTSVFGVRVGYKF